MSEREPQLPTYERVPAELRVLDQWVNWRRGQDAKIPINPRTLGNAGVTWPNTWSSFAVAQEMARNRDLGMGFVLTEDDPYTCVDLDHCIDQQGEISDETRSILDLLSGWVELSPSGMGLHVWVRNTQPVSRRTQGIEIYSGARWITVTARSNPRGPIAIPDRTAEVEELVERHFPAQEAALVPIIDPLPDDEIWPVLFASEQRELFRCLFVGDLSVCQDDHSRGVILLANQLARMTGGDAERMKRLLHQTALVNAKWESKRGAETWIDFQIRDAIRFACGQCTHTNE